MTPAWPFPGNGINMFLKEIPEKGTTLLQNPRTEKPEKRVVFNTSRNLGKEVL